MLRFSVCKSLSLSHRSLTNIYKYCIPNVLLWAGTYIKRKSNKSVCDNRVAVSADGLAERKNVYAKENLRSPEDLGNKKLSFSKDGVSVHVLPISFFKFRIILFVSFIVSGKPSLQSPTVKRS